MLWQLKENGIRNLLFSGGAVKFQKYTTFFITISPCGHFCKHCYNIMPNISKKYKSLEEVLLIIDKISILTQKKIEKVDIIFNDDPFSHKNIVEILDYMKEKGLDTTPMPITNGLFLAKRKNREAIIAKYKEYGITGIGFSLFGLKEKHDNFVAQKGSFENVLEAIKLTQKHSLDYFINLFLTADNIDDIIHLKKEHQEKAIISIFEDSKQLNKKENQKYRAKYKDFNTLRNMKFLDDPYSNQDEYSSAKNILRSFNDNKFLLDKARILGKDIDSSYFCENNYNLYDSASQIHFDKVGDLHYNNLEEVVEKYSLSLYIYEIFFKENLNNLRKILNKWIEKEEVAVYFPEDLIDIAFKKELYHNLECYWFSLPGEKIKIFPEQKVTWSYIPKLKIFNIELNNKDWYIEGAWGQILNEMFCNKYLDQAMASAFPDNTNISITSETEKKFLELILELHKKKFIFLNISK